MMKSTKVLISEINKLLGPFIGKHMPAFDVSQIYCWPSNGHLRLYDNPVDEAYKLDSLDELQEIRFCAILLVPRMNNEIDGPELLFKKHLVYGYIFPSLLPHKRNFISREEIRSEVRERAHEVITKGSIEQVNYAGGVITFKKSITKGKYSCYIFPLYIVTTLFAGFDLGTFYMAGSEFVFLSKAEVELMDPQRTSTDVNRAVEALFSAWGFFRSYMPKSQHSSGVELISEIKISMTSILFLAADPADASRLRLGEEFREIQEKLKLAKLRDRFTLELPQLSVRPADIGQALLDTQPQIVHFSGHGASTGALCFESQVGQIQLVQPDALAALFEQFANQVNCVLLNACYSETQAKAIAKHIEYVIGMNQVIGDKAAIAFAIGFYQALGAGRTIEDAYKLGCVQIKLQGIPEHLTPVLIKKGQAQ